MNKKSKYDYTIIGCGPTGLTVGYILAKYGKKVLMVDSEDSIGGCHRVKRVDGYFTEHGPRIYFDAYVNTITLLKSMGLNFKDYFTPYKFNITTIGGQKVKDIPLNEIFWLATAFIGMVFNDNYVKSVTCLQFMEKHNFSDKTKDYFDRLCRLTDGAGIEKYTMLELLSTVNQHFFYQIYQPSRPNDIGLFADIKSVMQNIGIDFMLDSEVVRLIGENKIVGLLIKNKQTNFKDLLSVNNCILAIPPINMVEILKNSSINIKNSFGPLNELSRYTNYNSYNVYIPVVFHWNKKLELPKVWGFPKTEWGVAYIVLTDYMDFNQPNSKTVISCCTTIEDVGSNYSGKTVHQCTKEEVVEEVFIQLKESFPDLPKPTKSIFYPNVTKKNGKWYMWEDSYMITTDISDPKKKQFIPFVSPNIDNLYSVGVHSNHSLYNFNSMESAVSNGMVFANQIVPDSKKEFEIKAPISIIFVIRIVLIILVLVLLAVWFFR